MVNSFDIIKRLANSDLKEVMIELREMSKMVAPANHKQSKILKILFDSETTNCNYWLDRYYNIDTNLRIEIVNRFLE
jgi:hypothetical protein